MYSKYKIRYTQIVYFIRMLKMVNDYTNCVPTQGSNSLVILMDNF